MSRQIGRYDTPAQVWRHTRSATDGFFSGGNVLVGRLGAGLPLVPRFFLPLTAYEPQSAVKRRRPSNFLVSDKPDRRFPSANSTKDKLY
ncbi:unnamed protein product, partial [Iphiclides podalirius]